LERNSSLLPAHHVKLARSAAAFPLVREGSIGGCLLATSIQTDNFTTSRIKLLDLYADVIAELALCDQDFFNPEQIDLRVMPNDDVQEAAFRTFRERVNSLLTHRDSSGQPLTPVQAEQQIRQDLEEELLQWFSLHGETDMAAFDNWVRS
jgi:hypothetical protein